MYCYWLDRSIINNLYPVCASIIDDSSHKDIPRLTLEKAEHFIKHVCLAFIVLLMIAYNRCYYQAKVEVQS